MPVRDRLEELEAKREPLTESKKKEKTKLSIKEKSRGKDLKNFLNHASRIDSELVAYRSRVAELKRRQLEFVNSPFADKSAASRYENWIQELTHHGICLRNDIRDLEEQAKKYLERRKNDGTFKRMSRQQLNGFTAQLATVTNEFFKCQSDFADLMKDRLKRQLSARGETKISDEQVEEILEKGSYDVFTGNLLSEIEDDEEALQELEVRHREVVALEKRITDANQLFKELNMMVSEQGETLDNIRHNIEQVEVYVTAGNTQLNRARESRSKARRKKFCCLGLLVVGVVVVVVIIVIVAAKQTAYKEANASTVNISAV